MSVTRRTAVALALLLLAAATGCGGGGRAAPQPGAGTAGPPRPGSPSAASTTPGDPCAVGRQPRPPDFIAADVPTALAAAADGRLFYAERAGTVRVWQDGASRVFASVPTVTAERDGGYSERGLLGLALSPGFERDHLVYAFYSDSDLRTQHVVRWRDCRGTGTGPTSLITLPSGPDCCHKGGRLAFGPDGMLYVTLGEEHTAAAAQDVSDSRGKVLRYRPDGSVPTGNPFGPGNPVWDYGLRNPFGLAFSPAGQMAVTNNGPTGDAGSPATGYDTVILDAREGQGFQWPRCYGYSHLLPPATSCGQGQREPDWSSERETVVPTGAAFVDAAGPAGYAGHLVLCTFERGMLVVTPGQPHASVRPGPDGCRTDVTEAPDHSLYYAGPSGIRRLG